MSEEQVDYSQEEWRPVPGFESLYEVSSYGRVRSVDRTVTCKNGVLKTFRGKMLKPTADSHGYDRVFLCKNAEYTTIPVHRLVASAFKSNPDNLPQVDHKDANKRNNRADNLRWVTAKENSENRVYHYRLEHPLPEQWEPNPDDILSFSEEVWKPILGYEDAYEISSQGRVRSIDRYVKRGDSKLRVNGKDVSICLSSSGYHVFNVWRGSKYKRMFVHRAMAEAFLPNDHGFDDVVHLNHVRTDDRIENIAWCPKGYGALSAVRDGVIDPQKDRRGKPSPASYDRKGIAVIRNDGRRYESIKAAASDIDVVPQSIYQVLRGRQKTAGGHTFRYADDQSAS